MATKGDKIRETVTSFLKRQQNLEFSEKREQYSVRFDISSMSQSAVLQVYDSGKIVIQGPKNTLSAYLEKLKTAIETSSGLPGQLLPFEIEALPTRVREKVPACDPVVLRFFEEAIQCYKQDALLACAFMVGAASEKLANLLIQSYVDSVSDTVNRDKLQSRINNRMISARWDEFWKSFRGCKNRPPAGADFAQDLETVLNEMFNPCRITRNDVGHPQIVPDLDKGVLLARLGNFADYVKRIYSLIEYFKINGVQV